MSDTKSHPRDTETSSVNLREVTEDRTDDSVVKSSTCISNDSSCLDIGDRQRVLKEVGLTSTIFIGPVFPPNATTVKSDLEDKLSEFYEELEKIDPSDCANENREKQDKGVNQPPKPPKISTNKGVINVSTEDIVKSAKTDSYQKTRGQKQPTRPHWYHNEPYYPRGPRPQLPRRPPNPSFNRPPFHRPLPSAAFSNPHNPPSHANHNWSSSDLMHQEEFHFSSVSHFPPPEVCEHPSQGFYENSPYYFDRDQWACSSDAFSDDVDVGWPSDGKVEQVEQVKQQEQWNKNYDMHQRYDSNYEQWDDYHRPTHDNNEAYDSSFVLILMRGLPGSGKSTLARELLSTGPSGLILSTDDYFAYRDGYCYDVKLLEAAHDWNQRRAKAAMEDGRSPIIIDNTNIQAWEMKPYVIMALERGYQVDFCEPETSWKFDPYELEKRNKHGVPHMKITQMLDRYSSPISVDIVMNSQEPCHLSQRHQPQQQQQMKSHFH
ncbi:NEDD4-binding protein 2-like 2 isoform X2 [Antennarius striatus]|uniref:NEDD4-binding protein 2-like 2 isoform X2 n=1 Tax=Antennarius striatus TaxID=241820 RepID=UPI0035AE2453